MKSTRIAPLWRRRDFRLLWGGHTASIFGDRVTDIALPLLILFQTHSPFDAGLVAAARYIPIILLGLPAGVVADRANRKLLLICCDLGRAAALGVIVALGLAHQIVPLWLLALVVMLLGLGQLGFQSAYWAWLPDITGADQLGSATAALEASDAVSTLAGPAVGGAIIQATGPAIALGADAASYFISAASLACIRAEDTPPQRRSSESSVWVEALAGARYILRTPELRLLKGIGTALYFSTGSIVILLATLATLHLHLPPWQVGLIYGSAGIGGLIGSALAPCTLKLGWRRALAMTLTLATLGSGGLAMTALIASPVVGFFMAFGANLVLDGATALSFIITGTTNTLLTPPDLRGRVNAVSALFASAVRGLGLVATGTLAARGNTLPAFIALALCFAVAAIAAGHSPTPDPSPS